MAAGFIHIAGAASLRYLRLTRRRAIVLGSLAVVLLSAWMGVSWYYAGQIESLGFEIDRDPDELDLEIVSFEGGVVTLRHLSGGDLWERSRLWGLEWEGGYGQIGEILGVDGATSQRRFISIDGVPPAGSRARADSYAYPKDPAVAFSFEYEDIQFKSPLESMGGWFFDGAGDAWVLAIHGVRGHRAQTLRPL